jgi:hypothetical protein
MLNVNEIKIEARQIADWAKTRFPVTDWTIYAQAKESSQTVVLDSPTLQADDRDVVCLNTPAVLVYTPYGLLHIVAAYSEKLDILVYKFLAW